MINVRQRIVELSHEIGVGVGDFCRDEKYSPGETVTALFVAGLVIIKAHMQDLQKVFPGKPFEWVVNIFFTEANKIADRHFSSGNFCEGCEDYDKCRDKHCKQKNLNLH